MSLLMIVDNVDEEIENASYDWIFSTWKALTELDVGSLHEETRTQHVSCHKISSSVSLRFD